MLWKVFMNMSADAFESIWQNIGDEFTQRRRWVEQLDDKLAAVEDTRVDKVGTSVSLLADTVIHFHTSSC